MLGVIVLALLLGLTAYGIFYWGRHPLRPLEKSMVAFTAFLATLAIAIWAKPVGPLLWGIAWLPIVVGFFFVVGFVALGASKFGGREPGIDVSEKGSGLIFGSAALIWLLTICLSLAVLGGYYYA